MTDDRPYQLYFDGAVNPVPRGHGGAGAILLSPDGDVVAEAYRYLGDDRTSNECEYEALILGLETVFAAGVEHVIIYGDSQVTVLQIAGAYNVWATNLKILHRQAKALLREIPRWDITHISRKFNTRADALSRKGLAARPQEGAA